MDVIGVVRCPSVMRYRLIVDALQTYPNLLSNCCQKCQIIALIETGPNKLQGGLRMHFCARFRPWIY